MSDDAGQTTENSASLLARNFRRLHEIRFIRFLIAGAMNTLFGFAVYSAFISAGAALWLALLAGTLLGTAFNFITTGGYAFRTLSLSRFPRFVICYLLVYGINYMLIRLVDKWLNDRILAQAILVFPMALLSYFLMRRFVFPDSGDSQSGQTGK